MTLFINKNFNGDKKKIVNQVRFIKLCSRIFFIIGYVLLTSPVNILAQNEPIDNQLTIITYNIRFAGGDPSTDPDHWLHRREFVSDILKKNNTDVFGLQEALIEQITYLDSTLAEYDWVGVGRDDGYHKGEFSPIFYKKERFELIAKGTFWLSETPHKPSKGWDAALNRITTWVQLKDITSGILFYVYNTHFDHIGDSARYESSKLILKKIREETSTDPVILIGDFNFNSSSKGYNEIISAENQKRMFDAQFISKTRHTGGNITFNGFGDIQEPGEKIDFIFVTDNILVLRHSVMAEKYNNRFPSDHYPVLSSFSFK